jgi:hypothetical protein
LTGYGFAVDAERWPVLTSAMLRYWHPRRRSSIFIELSDATHSYLHDGVGVVASSSPEGVVLSALSTVPTSTAQSGRYAAWWRWAEQDRGLGPVPGESITVPVDGAKQEARYEQLSPSRWLLVFPHALDGTWVAVHGNMRVSPADLEVRRVHLPDLPAEFPLPPIKRTRKPRCEN